MKQCPSCGKIEESNNAKHCGNCGTVLIEYSGDSTGYAGTSDYYGAVPADTTGYERGYVPPARKNRTVTVLLITLLCLLLVAVSVIATMTVMKSGDEDKKDKTVAEETEKSAEQREKKEQQEEETGETGAETKTPQPEPQPTPQPESQPTVSRYELESSIDGFVQSYVAAMNSGDSTYMLPYVIQNSPIYGTQKAFIKNGYYEEYVDSYINSEIKMEDRNTCVVSVYEIYNVQRPGESLKRTEQTATYRMKRDSDGVWKAYDFVGQVVSHTS